MWFWVRCPKLSPESLETIDINIREAAGMGIKLEPGDLEACDAAMRAEQAAEDYLRAKMQQSGAEMNDKEIEREIQTKGLTAPRVTPEHLESRIAAEAYITGDAIPVWLTYVAEFDTRPRITTSLSCLTVCVLVLKNGFTVTGESACASPENFNSELGRKIARQKAVEKIWALEGYLLKDKLERERQVVESLKDVRE